MMRYRPTSLLNELFRELQPAEWGKNFWLQPEMPSMATSQWQPSVDIKEEDNRIIIKADIPGVEVKDIQVNVQDGVLSIRGERESEKKEQTEHYKRVERVWGSFERSFSLPETADTDHISAKGKNGVLEITIPKTKEKKGSKKIEVKE